MCIFSFRYGFFIFKFFSIFNTETIIKMPYNAKYVCIHMLLNVTVITPKEFHMQLTYFLCSLNLHEVVESKFYVTKFNGCTIKIN